MKLLIKNYEIINLTMSNIFRLFTIFIIVVNKIKGIHVNSSLKMSQVDFKMSIMILHFGTKRVFDINFSKIKILKFLMDMV